MVLKKIVRELSLKTTRLGFAGFIIYSFLLAPTTLFAEAVKTPPLDFTSGGGEQRRTLPVRKPQLPLYFIENRGQTDPQVAYYAHGRNKVLYFARRN